MWNRREAVLGGSLTLLFSAHNCCACASEKTAGCYIADSDLKTIYPSGTETRVYSTGNEPIIYKSGDANFDFALAHTLVKLSHAFDVRAGFAYYDDKDEENAYATPRVRLNGINGTVLMGQNFLQALRRSREHPDVAVASICSHEFGHILQFKHGLGEKVDFGQRTVKRSELQADYFAGYFAGLRKRERPEYPAAVAASSLFKLGGNNIADRNHHGTRDERGKAVVRGFEASYRLNKSLSEAMQESTTYVMSL